MKVPIEINRDECFLSRAMFIHLMYEKCCGVLVYTGDFPSNVADGIVESVFKCKKCNGKVTLI